MKAYRYKIQLTQPIRLGNQWIEQREGVLFETDNGWSEAAPLPHFSGESIDDVIHAIKHKVASPPSLQFAKESQEQPISAQTLSINALLQGSTKQVLERCRELADSPCNAAKLKVGRDSVQADAALVHAVRKELRSNQTLRLDANRAWDWLAATDFASRVKDLEIEFIEEPLQDNSRLEEFATSTQLPYAIDESVCEYLPLRQFERATAIVIKPTLVGSERLREAVSLGKPIVFSACYETGVGLARIVQLANQTGTTAPAGLDTYSYLAEDVLMNRLKIKDWKIHIPSSLEVDREQLEEILL